MKTDRERERDRRIRADYYLAHKVGGVCVNCTAEAEPDTIFCARHRAMKRAQNARARAKRAASFRS